ncbi:MAG: PorP/SprF family type IX secretion system membrane protein [Spirosomaceae bacterium]|nr:PorP/SprF family type IX secretion system membrane protein [Spirosomataceae bacterium]
MNKKNLLTLIGSLVSLVTLAQDPQFSQFYAAPLYINPAFAGSSMAPRLIANYRNQWPSLDANFVTSAVSADLYFDKVNSGLGLLVVNDTQGFSKLKRTQINLQYSYGFRLSEGTTIKLGVQGGQHFSNVDDYGLIYGYQQISGSTFTPVTTDPISGNIQRSINYLNFGGGVLLYNEKSWFGFSGHNVNRPNVSMINADSRLPVKYSAHGGVNIPIRTAGAWYRGIPIKQLNSGARNNDALIALIGFRQDAFSIGYSYDITVSNLGFSTGGAHELSIAYQFDAFEPEPKRSRRRNKELSCPKF